MKSEVWKEWLPWLLAIAIAMWFSDLAAFSISIDDELAAVRTDPAVWVVQGRWATYLIERFLFPFPTVPFFTNALFCVSAAVSYLLVTSAHRTKLDWQQISFFPIFVAYPTWMFIAEFYANMPATAAGLAFCALAIFSFTRSSRIEATAFQIAILALSLGTYQSFVFLFIAMVIGTALATKTMNARSAAIHLIRGAGVTVAAVILYFITLKLFLVSLGRSPAYVGNLIHLEVLAAHPLQTIEKTVLQMGKIYAGSASIFGVPIFAAAPLLALGLVGTVFSSRSRIVSAILLAALLPVPFILNVASGYGTMPIRTLVAVPYIIWLLAVASLDVPRMRSASLILVGIATIQIAYALSVHSASARLALERDKLVASQINERIVSVVPDFDRNRSYKVDFFGAMRTPLPLPKLPSSTAGYSFFEWDGGNRIRIIAFMNLMGFTSLKPASQHEAMALIQTYKAMPLWPSEGSVRLVDGIIAVKLGKTPGVMHAIR